LPYKQFRASLLAEFLGTWVLVTCAALTSVKTHLLGMDPYTVHFIIGIVVGAVIVCSILTIGKVSGAHLNPSVSIAHAVRGLMPRRLLAPYLASQLLAAVMAGIVLAYVCRSIHSPQYGLTQLQQGTSVPEGIALEFVGTFLLCDVAIIASTRFKDRFKQQALIVGITLFALTVVIGPFTGASFNPSRSLGPAVASLDFEYQYIYWLGPIAGCLLASAFFAIFASSSIYQAKNALAPQQRKVS
jgi:MIP family channel proteins